MTLHCRELFASLNPSEHLVVRAVAQELQTLKREQLRAIIFQADTPAGKLYDVLLILTIALSVLVVMLDSVAAMHDSYGKELYCIEWFFTVLFTIDYVVRLRSVEKPLGYALSFFGVVDLLGVVPTYVSLFIPGSHYLAVIRFLRVLRTFRVLNLSTYQEESYLLIRVLKASQRRIIVFLFSVLTIVVFIGALMYMIEGADNGFTSIPRSIYWAIVTLTTVGYGDISPGTGPGQALAAVIMILGYSIIVIPTGIIASTMSDVRRSGGEAVRCPACGRSGHDSDAVHCKYCGSGLDESRFP